MTSKFNAGAIVALNSVPYRECRVLEIDTAQPEKPNFLIRFYDPYKDRLITDWYPESALQVHNTDKMAELFE